jgi:predicted RNA binding protein YcfA (HicA-like mRNA interferase family)
LVFGCHQRQPQTIQHPKKLGRVTIAGHPNDDLAPGTQNSIFKQAQVEKPKGKK